MPVKFDRSFLSVDRRIKRIEKLQLGLAAARQFAQHATEAMADLADISGITYTGDSGSWRENFKWKIENIHEGRFSYQIEFYNDAEHADWITDGAGPGRYPNYAPPEVIIWAEEKLGLDAGEAWYVAKTIHEVGTQQSDGSVLRRLPPSGEVGYEPILHLEQSGMMYDLLTEFRIATARRLKSYIERGH